jgi:hypothetical protein
MTNKPPKIETTQQYFVTKGCLQGFKNSLLALDGLNRPDMWKKLYRDALLSIIEELAADVKEYEDSEPLNVLPFGPIEIPPHRRNR